MKKNTLIRSVVVALMMAFSVFGGISTVSAADYFKGVSEYKESISEAENKYDSTRDNINTILVRGGNANFTKPIISKFGNGTANDGRNAAALAINSSKLRINGGEIKTDGKYADAVFAIGDSSLKLSNVSVYTIGDFSNVVTVSDGASAVVEGISIETNGNSAAFSYAEGKGTSTITAEKSTINLSGYKKLLNVDSDAVFKMKKMTVTGDVWVDKGVLLELNLSERAELVGKINNDKAGTVDLVLDSKSRIILTDNSYVSSLTNGQADNSNIYANGHKLYVNGVETKINEAEPEKWEWDLSTDTGEPKKAEEVPEEKDKSMLYNMLIVSSILFMIALVVVFMLFKNYKRNKQKMVEKKTIEKSSNNKMKRPWEKA